MGIKPHITGVSENEGQAAVGYHTPVLLEEAITALNIKANGVYVDCTFGGGGHSKAILEKLGAAGKLIAFDQDAAAQENLPQDDRVIFVPHNFRHIQRFLRLHRINGVDGVFADLGVSSHQFDEAERGFSIRFDAALDMRMDQRTALKAADIIATYSEQQLHRLFEQYGEVTNSKTLARTIVELRGKVPMKTVNQFKAALQGIVKGNPNKYFAQVFQALRIEVNDELGALKEMLLQLTQVLLPGGRVAIITFHSLEDRLVKVFFKEGSFEKADEHPFENRTNMPGLTVISKKPVVPKDEETKMNPRARSAKLRIAEKKLE
jgi:16S rRNA (cytosine1402-N4)-methyltransferase